MITSSLSLVLPAHNEVDNIAVVVSRAHEVLSSVVHEFEIIIVNDGSQDGTSDVAERLTMEFSSVRVVHHPVNLGYGAALTSGIRASTKDLVMIMDADQQFDIADIRKLLPHTGQYDIVAGYRLQRRDPAYRRFYAALFGLVVRTLFGLKVRDIDCAFKIFRADLIRTVPMTMPGALINTELLARSKQRGASLIQVGVNHYPRTAGASSGGSPRVVLRAIIETVRLWHQLRYNQSVIAPSLYDQKQQVLSTPSVTDPETHNSVVGVGAAGGSGTVQD